MLIVQVRRDLVSTIPLLIIYPFSQKYFNKGVMIGAVKLKTMTRVALTYERLCRIVLMVFVVNVAVLVHAHGTDPGRILPLNRRRIRSL